MSSTTVYPNGDGTLGGWAISGGGTSNIYTTIDEGTASPNDSDSIVCSTGSSSYYVLLGDMPSDFGTATAVSIKVRAQYTSGKGVIKSFDCRLVQSDESTAITANTTTSASGSLTTYTISPSITGGTSKTVWDGARLKLTTASGASGGILVAAVQVEITYTTAGITATPTAGSLAATAQTPSATKSSSQSVVSLASTARTPAATKSTATTAAALTASAHTPTTGRSYTQSSIGLTIAAHDAVATIDHTVHVSALPLYINAHAPETLSTAHYAHAVDEAVPGYWTSLGNATGETDWAYASADQIVLGGSGGTSYIYLTDFQFDSSYFATVGGGSLDADQRIKSIRFTLIGKTDAYPNTIETKAYMLYNGAQVGDLLDVGSPQIVGEWRTSASEIAFGGVDDWGSGLDTTDIVNSALHGDTFGIAVQTLSGGPTGRHIEIDSVRCDLALEWYITTAAITPSLTITAHDAIADKVFSASSTGLAITARTPDASKSLSATATSLTITAHDAAAYREDDWRHVTALSLAVSSHAPDTSKFNHMATSWTTASVATPAVYFVKTPDPASLTIATHEPIVTEWHAPRVPLTITPQAPAGTKSTSTTALSLTETVHTPNTYKGVFVSVSGVQLTVSTHAPVAPAVVSRVALTITAHAPHVVIPASSRSLTVASQLPIGRKKVAVSSQSLAITAHDAHVNTLIDVSRQRLRITPCVPRSVKVVTVSSLSLSLTGHAPTRTTKRAAAGYASLAITPHAPVYSQTVRPTAVPLVIAGRTPVSSKQFSTTANELQMQTNVCYNRKSFSVTRLPLTTTPRTPNKTSFFRVSSLGLHLTPRPPLSSKSSTAGHGSLALSVADSSGRLGNLAADSGERRKWYRGSEYQPTGVGREDELRERYRSSNADEVRVVNPQR